jgi:hypothetical protein
MIELLLILIICGVALYLVENFIPMPQPVKIVIRVVVVLFLVLVLLRAFGIGDVPIPRVR